MQVVSAKASVRTADTVRRHRLGGLTLDEYAQASAAREIELDEASVVVTWSGIQGGSDTLWPRLEEQAKRYGVPFVAGDLEHTNRIQEWDDLIASSRHAQAAWRDSYARALLALLGLDPETMDGRTRVEVIKGSELCLNAVAPLQRRRVGMTGLAVRPTDRRTPVPPAPTGLLQASVDADAPVDPVVFPGEKLARVSDFVRVEIGAQNSGLDAALAREGLDAATYTRALRRWEARLRKDPWLAEKHHAWRENAGAPASKRGKASRVAKASAVEKSDPVVFPGEKLARLSDFVRMARAARSADFLGTLHAEGLHPVYYAHMCKRLDAVRKLDKALDQAYVDLVGTE